MEQLISVRHRKISLTPDASCNLVRDMHPVYTIDQHKPLKILPLKQKTHIQQSIKEFYHKMLRLVCGRCLKLILNPAYLFCFSKLKPDLYKNRLAHIASANLWNALPLQK